MKLNTEFQNVLKWAKDNKLKLNLAKTKELVFHRPNARNYLPPEELPGVERVLYAKLLGVWLKGDLSTRKHVDYILHICNQRIYLLSQLRKQGLPLPHLQCVFDAIILSRIVYASPAWRDYLSAADIDCLQHIFVKAKRWNVVFNNYDVNVLFDNSDWNLFKSAQSDRHCLYHLYPDKRLHTHAMTMRPRGHNFSLPCYKYEIARNSFISRSLFNFV